MGNCKSYSFAIDHGGRMSQDFKDDQWLFDGDDDIIEPSFESKMTSSSPQSLVSATPRKIEDLDIVLERSDATNEKVQPLPKTSEFIRRRLDESELIDAINIKGKTVMPSDANDSPEKDEAAEMRTKLISSFSLLSILVRLGLLLLSMPFSFNGWDRPRSGPIAPDHILIEPGEIGGLC